jgi:hypothetical protein
VSKSSCDELTVDLPRLHPNQEKVKAEAARYNVLNCGRRFGKSILGEDLTIEGALDGKRVGWFAPEYKLLAEAWRDMLAILGPVVSHRDANEKRIELITGGVIEAWSFDRTPNAGRSRKYHRVVFDEAAHCQNLETAWTKAVRPTLTDFKGDAWFLSSPNGENYFHTLYQNAAGRSDWRAWTFTSFDNPFLDPAEIEGARLDLPAWVFEQEYLAKFHAEGGDRLVPASWIDRALAATRPDGEPAGPRRLALDIAKGTGRDRTVAIVADDLGVLALTASSTTDLTAAANLVRDLSWRYGVRHDSIVYDAGGWAGPDFGRYLAAVGVDEAVPYLGGGSGGHRFKNRRSRSAWALRQRLDPDRQRIHEPPNQPLPDHAYPAIVRATPDRPKPPRATVQPPFAMPPAVLGPHADDLRRELAELRYTYDGKTALEPKDDLMARLGRSPDLADAMIMLASLWGVE